MDCFHYASVVRNEWAITSWFMIIILDQKAIQLDKDGATLSFKASVHLKALFWSGFMVWPQISLCLSHISTFRAVLQFFLLSFGYHLGRNSLSQRVSKIYGNGRSDVLKLQVKIGRRTPNSCPATCGSLSRAFNCLVVFLVT